MHVLIHGDVARPRGGRAVIERYRNARPARVIRPSLHGRAVQRNGRRLRPAAEREDVPRRAGDRYRLRIPLRDRSPARQVQRVRIQSAAGLPRGRSHRRPQSILYSQNSFTLSNKINRISLSLEILEQYPYVCLFFLGNKKTFIWQIIRRRKDRFCCYSYMFVNIKVYSLKIYRMRLSKLKRAEN